MSINYVESECLDAIAVEVDELPLLHITADWT